MGDSLTFEERRLKYLKLRAELVIKELEQLSKDSRFTHKCGNYLVIIGSALRRNLLNEDRDLDHLESIIINAEHYLVTIAQKF